MSNDRSIRPSDSTTIGTSIPTCISASFAKVQPSGCATLAHPIGCARRFDVEVTRELVLPAPPDEVWEALTDPERLKEWFANDVEWDGDELVYRWDDGEERRARIDELDAPRRLGFRWREDGGDETQGTFELEEGGGRHP